MNNNKFGRREKYVENKKSWYEANRCSYEHGFKQCRILGTSRSSGEKWFCSYHIDVLKGSRGGKFNSTTFGDWYGKHFKFCITPDQFTGFYPEDVRNPNEKPEYSKEKELEIWEKVSCL